MKQKHWTLSCWWAFRCWCTASCTTAPPCYAMDAFWVLCPRPICPTTASSTKSASSPRAAPRWSWWRCVVSRCPLAPPCCSAAARCPALCWAWRSARICGAPCRPPPSTRWPVRPRSQIFPPAMRPSARPSTAGRWCPTSLPACCAATCMLPPGTVRARRTWCSPATT